MDFGYGTEMGRAALGNYQFGNCEGRLPEGMSNDSLGDIAAYGVMVKG